MRTSHNNDIIIFLIANKIDLTDSIVNSTIAKEYADSMNTHFIETSAKTNYNINELFNTIAIKVPKIKETLPLIIDNKHKGLCC